MGGGISLDEKWERAVREFYPPQENTRQTYDDIKDMANFSEPRIDSLRKQKEYNDKFKAKKLNLVWN
jgi:hypothetical protein